MIVVIGGSPAVVVRGDAPAVVRCDAPAVVVRGGALVNTTPLLNYLMFKC